LDRLLKRDRNAATVFVALVALAGGRRQLNTTRGTVRSLCGLSERCIGSAIEALHHANILKRRYGRAGSKTWFRLTLPTVDLGALWYGKRPVVRKATHREAARRSKSDTQGIRPCGIENDTLSLEREAASAALGRGRPPLASVEFNSSPEGEPISIVELLGLKGASDGK